LADGSYVELLPDGSTRPSIDKTDWAQLSAMPDDQVARAASGDPDAQPLSDSTIRRRLPQVRVIRRALQLTQEEFAAVYHIPIGTLRDWEQGRVQPDQTARAYLRAISGDPDGVRRALAAQPA